MIQKIKNIFRLSNSARKIFWVARIFDATLPNFTNGRAINPLSSVSYAYGNNCNKSIPTLKNDGLGRYARVTRARDNHF